MDTLEHVNTVIARRVRTLRRRAALSQQELANRIPGWDKSTASKVERGERRLLLAEAQLVATALECSVLELLHDVT